VSTPPQIILFHPENPLNIGGVARAMVNLSFDSLSLVNPPTERMEEARITARKASSLLDRATICSDLDSALSRADFVVGFSTTQGKNTPPVIDLPFLSEALAEAGAGSPALLFGPESVGLTYRELAYCSLVVRIPSSDQFDSLNLAQAVMLAMYEWRRHCIVSQDLSSVRIKAPMASYSTLSNLITECAERSEFRHKGTSKRVMTQLINLYRRIPLSPREMKIMLGFLSRISKTLRRDKDLHQRD